MDGDTKYGQILLTTLFRGRGRGREKSTLSVGHKGQTDVSMKAFMCTSSFVH